MKPSARGFYQRGCPRRSYPPMIDQSMYTADKYDPNYFSKDSKDLLPETGCRRGKEVPGTINTYGIEKTVYSPYMAVLRTMYVAAGESIHDEAVRSARMLVLSLFRGRRDPSMMITTTTATFVFVCWTYVTRCC